MTERESESEVIHVPEEIKRDGSVDFVGRFTFELSEQGKEFFADQLSVLVNEVEFRVLDKDGKVLYQRNLTADEKILLVGDTTKKFSIGNVDRFIASELEFNIRKAQRFELLTGEKFDPENLTHQERVKNETFL